MATILLLFLTELEILLQLCGFQPAYELTVLLSFIF